MFKIGEFAKIAQVSGRLLRYYDGIGLFTPEQIDPDSGYRFYSAAQLPRLNRILALRDLGLTLDQIGRMLDGDISGDEIRGMLFMRKAQIEQNLQEEIGRLNQVELRLKQIEQEDHPWTADVIIKEVPALPILACSLRDLENRAMWLVISAVMGRPGPQLGLILWSSRVCGDAFRIWSRLHPCEQPGQHGFEFCDGARQCRS